LVFVREYFVTDVAIFILYQTFKFDWRIIINMSGGQKVKKKITALLVCLLMIATIPLAAGVMEDRESESPTPDIVGRVWLRGWLFRRIKSGNVNNAIAIRLHYIEFTPTERTWGIVMFKRVAFRNFLYIGRMYETPLGVLVYVFGFFRGGLEIY